MISTADTRSHEILDAVKAVFAQKGFDGASMKDLAQAAGMSAGNFYRYFPSKDAIIEALIARDLDEVQRDFALVLQASDVRAAFSELVRQRVESMDVCDAPIWAEIEAAAVRRPEIGAMMQRMEHEIIHSLIKVFARIADIPHARAKTLFFAHARLILLLVQGLSMQSNGSGGAQPSDRALARLVFETIDYTLAGIAATGHSSAPLHS